MSERQQTPFDRAVAEAADEFRRELEAARAEEQARIEAGRTPWWKKRGRKS